MELSVKDLKTKITKNSRENYFLVMVCPGSTFLANHYIDGIASVEHKTKVYLESQDGFSNLNDAFDTKDENSLFIYYDKEFESKSSFYNEFTNVIVVCNKVADTTLLLLKETTCSYIVELPELQEWQIIDYMHHLCAGLDDAQIKWLYEVTGGDMNRILNEMRKISIFDTKDQSDIFNQINDDGGYSDLSSMTIYNLTNAILKKDRKTVATILAEINNIDVEGVGLVTILHKNIKNIMSIQMNSKATASSLGMSEKQFAAISYSCGKFTNTQLISIFDLLTSMDMRLKLGNLQLTNEKLIDFIVCTVLSY